MLRQQRLLEKAASLSSSPINLLQAIAAKALNFKLRKKRREDNQNGGGGDDGDGEDLEDTFVNKEDSSDGLSEKILSNFDIL